MKTSLSRSQVTAIPDAKRCFKLRHSGASAGRTGAGTRNPALRFEQSKSWIPGSARKQRGQPRNDNAGLPGFEIGRATSTSRFRRRKIVLLAFVALFTTFACAAFAKASPAAHVRAPPDLLQRVGFDQELGAQVPMGGRFFDAHGKPVTLGGLAHGRPTLLVPGYFHCANLCGIVRAGVANAVAASGFVPDQQFNVVLVSIDPRDTPASALATKRNDAFAHAGAHVAQWHYLTGPQVATAALMRSIGFRYFYDSRNGQYGHAAGVVLLTPEGKVSQYLFGVKFPARTLRLALVHASGDQIGNIVDAVLLLCCRYDTSTGRYTLVIHHIMQGLGISTALLLCLAIALLRRSERRRGHWTASADGRPEDGKPDRGRAHVGKPGDEGSRP